MFAESKIKWMSIHRYLQINEITNYHLVDAHLEIPITIKIRWTTHLKSESRGFVMYNSPSCVYASPVIFGVEKVAMYCPKTLNVALTTWLFVSLASFRTILVNRSRRHSSEQTDATNARCSAHNFLRLHCSLFAKAINASTYNKFPFSAPLLKAD